MPDVPGLRRSCTECGKPLPEGSPKNRFTDSQKCRTARSKRLRREKSHPEITAAVYRQRTDVTREVVQEELRPVVRAAITEEVLRSIQELVGLAPRVIELLEQDLESPDPQIRQKAYSLIAKYTLGHTAIVTPVDEAKGQLTVNFSMPRPSDVPESDDVPLDVEFEEVVEQECLFCNERKPITQFVAGSDRCLECHEKLQDRAQELLDASRH